MFVFLYSFLTSSLLLPSFLILLRTSLDFTTFISWHFSSIFVWFSLFNVFIILYCLLPSFIIFSLFFSILYHIPLYLLYATMFVTCLFFSNFLFITSSSSFIASIYSLLNWFHPFCSLFVLLYTLPHTSLVILSLIYLFLSQSFSLLLLHYPKVR